MGSLSATTSSGRSAAGSTRPRCWPVFADDLALNQASDSALQGCLSRENAAAIPLPMTYPGHTDRLLRCANMGVGVVATPVRSALGITSARFAYRFSFREDAAARRIPAWT